MSDTDTLDTLLITDGSMTILKHLGIMKIKQICTTLTNIQNAINRIDQLTIIVPRYVLEMYVYPVCQSEQDTLEKIILDTEDIRLWKILIRKGHVPTYNTWNYILIKSMPFVRRMINLHPYILINDVLFNLITKHPNLNEYQVEERLRYLADNNLYNARV